jgi:hypothetical protein
MIWTHRRRVALCALALLAAGCTSLREIPRSEYAASPERKNVRIVTRDGLKFEFDFVTVDSDSLVGYRHRDVEGLADEYATVRIPLDDISALSARHLDWYRTGLIGGGVIAAIVAHGLTGSDNQPTDAGNGGGGGGTRVP